MLESAVNLAINQRCSKTLLHGVALELLRGDSLSVQQKTGATTLALQSTRSPASLPSTMDAPAPTEINHLESVLSSALTDACSRGVDEPLVFIAEQLLRASRVPSPTPLGHAHGEGVEEAVVNKQTQPGEGDEDRVEAGEEKSSSGAGSEGLEEREHKSHDPARTGNNTVDVRITLDAWPQLVQQLYAAMQRGEPQQPVGPTAPGLTPLAGPPHQPPLAFSPFPRGAPPSAWLPAEVSVEAVNSSPAVVGIVNLAAARTVAQLRPLLSTELTEGALPRQYSFVLQNGLEVNSRQEETWPAIALQAGGVRLRPTTGDVGNVVPTGGERGRLETPSSERSETQRNEAYERAPAAASAAASAVATASTGETSTAKRLIVEQDREAARARLDGEISSLEQLEKEVAALEFQAFAQRDGSLEQLSKVSETTEPWAPSQRLDDRVCRIECESVLEFAIQQANQAMEEVPTPSKDASDGGAIHKRVAAVKPEVHYEPHTHFEELRSSCGSSIFRAPLDDEARQVMKLAWMLQAVLDYEYHRDRLTKGGAQPEHFQGRVPPPISQNWFGPWRITRVLDPHGDRGIVLKACRASADTVQERAVMLLPRPSADRESVTLTRAEVRSLERATLVSTIVAPSVLQVDATYGVTADLRLGWRFMESLGDHVTTMERALKVQAAAADTAATATISSVAVAAPPTSAEEVAKRCHRAVKEGLQLLAALKPLHAKRIVHAALAPRHVAVARDGTVHKLLGLGSVRLSGSGNDSDLTVDGDRLPGLPDGVVEYSAPEMRERGAVIDERADLYSVGMIMLASISGQPCSLDEAMIDQQLADVDTRLANVLLKALNRRPALRYSSAEAFEHALKDVATLGRGESWDVYISYRAPSDWYSGTVERELALKLHDELAKRTLARSSGVSIRVRLDRYANKPGTTLRDTIVHGIGQTAIFVPIVSRGSLVKWAGMPPPPPRARPSQPVASPVPAPSDPAPPPASAPVAAPPESRPQAPGQSAAGLPALPAQQRVATQLHSSELAFDRRLNPKATVGSAADQQRYDALLLEWQTALALHDRCGGSKYANACHDVLPLFLGPPIYAAPGDASSSAAVSPSEGPRRVVGFRSFWDELVREGVGAGTIRGMRGLTLSEVHEAHPGISAAVVGGRDDEAGYFVEHAMPEHRSTLEDLFRGGDENDEKLAEAAGRLSPAVVVRKLFDLQGKFSHLLVPSKAVSYLPAKGTPDTNGEFGRESDGLDELAASFADIVEKAVDNRSRANFGLGRPLSTVADPIAPLEPLTGQLTYMALLGPKLVGFGHQRMLRDTNEALLGGGSGGSPTVLLFFGQSKHSATRSLRDRLVEAFAKRAARGSGGGGSADACHVVYIALNETRADLEAFAQTAAASRSVCWWAMPIRNGASYGERARKLLDADAVPCVVVTRWSWLAAVSTGTGGGSVEVLNEDAAKDIDDDKDGVHFPWIRQSVGELMGERLLRGGDGSIVVPREDALRDCDVLALYFGGEWCKACQEFKRKADATYAQLRMRRFEMVYVSCDESKVSCKSVFFHRPSEASSGIGSCPLTIALVSDLVVLHRRLSAAACDRSVGWRFRTTTRTPAVP